MIAQTADSVEIAKFGENADFVKMVVAANVAEIAHFDACA